VTGSEGQIAFHGIDKHYRRRRILSSANITLRGGCCTLLYGENGAGKTTLMRIIAGLERPDRCRVDCGLGEISWRRYRRTLQQRVLYLHQQPYMFDRSVRDNLAFVLSRRHGRGRDAAIDAALDWAGLTRLAAASARELSGGERQRVALARAWLRQPGILLLDEPTTNLDQAARLRTLQLLAELRQQGITLLVASHEIHLFQAIADEHLLLEDGRISLMRFDTPRDNITALPLHHGQQAGGR